MKRRGFTLVFGIFVLFLMGTLGVYSLYISSQTVKTVADEYVSNQLKLYMYSAIELDLLWLSADKQRSQQGRDLNVSFEDGKYQFEIYNSPTSLSNISESNGTVIIDVIGQTQATGETIRITKRLVKKP